MDLALAASSVLVIPSTLAGAAMVAVLAQSPAQWEGGKRGLLPIHKTQLGCHSGCWAFLYGFREHP